MMSFTSSAQSLARKCDRQVAIMAVVVPVCVLVLLLGTGHLQHRSIEGISQTKKMAKKVVTPSGTCASESGDRYDHSSEFQCFCMLRNLYIGRQPCPLVKIDINAATDTFACLPSIPIHCFLERLALRGLLHAQVTLDFGLPASSSMHTNTHGALKLR